MVERLVWDRFRRDWKQFAWIAVWTFLSSVPLVLPLPIVGAWFLGSYISERWDGAPLSPTPGLAAGALVWSPAVAMVLVAAASIAFAAVFEAGLMAQVVAFRRGQALGFRTFWAGVRRHWVPLLLPAVFWGSLEGLNAGSMLAHPLRHASVGLVIAVFALHLGIYPAYFIVADDLGSMSALGRGLRILVARPREALMGVLALWLMQMAVSVLGELVGLASPFLLLPWLIVLMFYVPLVPYYFAERFEQKLRPVLN